MGDRVLVVLLEHPWFVVGMIALVTIFVLSIKKVFEDVTAGIDGAENTRRRRQEQLDKALEMFRERNQRVTDELLTLTDLARQQLLGRTNAEAEQEVSEAFARLGRLIDTFDKDQHQPWVRAVVDNYRASVRTLMQRHERKSESPVTLIEVLEDLHKKAVSDLQLRKTRDGRYKVFFPSDAEGKPFRLQK